jgi:hypothetical protein
VLEVCIGKERSGVACRRAYGLAITGTEILISNRNVLVRGLIEFLADGTIGGFRFLKHERLPCGLLKVASDLHFGFFLRQPEVLRGTVFYFRLHI